MAWTSETAKRASDRGHASMTPEQRRARAQKAGRAAAIRTAYVLVTQTPEVFTPRQRDEMVSALALHVDSNSADPAEAPQTEVTP